MAHDSDLELVREVAIEAVAGITGVLQDPAPKVIFENLSSWAIDFKVYYWIDLGQTGVLAAQDAGVRALKELFEEEGIKMPHSDQAVHLRLVRIKIPMHVRSLFE